MVKSLAFPPPKRMLFRNGSLYTQNLCPGKRVYGEELCVFNGKEYRRWDPFRSKLCAACLKGLRTFAFTDDIVVLYLGASTGTTISHLSDIMPRSDIVGVEISPVMIKDLVSLAEKRENIVPVLADARKPEEYADVGEADVLYQDVAQPDQAQIFIKNAMRYLKPGGVGYLCVKSQSIDVVKSPEEVYGDVEQELTDAGMKILEKIRLEPYEKHHEFLVVRRQ